VAAFADLLCKKGHYLPSLRFLQFYLNLHNGLVRFVFIFGSLNDKIHLV